MQQRFALNRFRCILKNRTDFLEDKVFKSKKKGFTLVELVLVISAGLIISFTAFQTMTKKQELLRADIVGQQIKDVGEAVNVYIANHYNQLSTLTNATGTADDAGPRTCNTGNQNCTITTATLSNEGLLPPTFSGKNAYNSTYTILLKRGGVSPYFTISGLVTTTDPWKGAANAIRYDWLGTAMQAAGLDSGMTRDIGTRVNGYNGQWVADSATYSNITQLGQLAYLTGYGSNSYSVYLRRDGVLPMTGQLNMSGNDINGAKNITASANIKANGTIAGGVVTSESNVSAKNGYGDTISMGGDSSGNDYELYMSTSGKPLSIYNSATGGSPSTTNKSTTLLKISGAIESGDINSVGDVNAGNWLTAKNGLGNTMRIGGDATGDYDIVFDPSSNSNNSVGFFSTNSAVPLDFLFRGTITATNTAGTARGVFLDGNKGEVIANSWVSGKNGYGDTISMGGDASSNDYEIKLGADKPLSIYSPNKVGNPVIFQVQGARGFFS